MAGFVIYLDAPDGSAEPPEDLLREIQHAIEEEHGDWTVRFDYTRTARSNASVYVGVSVSGGGFLDDPTPVIQDVRRLIAEVDNNSDIVVARTRHSAWDFG